MSKQTLQRKKRSPDEKIALLKRHLIDGKKVSDICEQENLAPSQFYSWQQALFENGSLVFEAKKKSAKQAVSTQVQQLQSKLDKAQAKLTEKHEVLSELMSEHIRLKKNFGD